MESAVFSLEKSVKTVDDKLDLLNWKVSKIIENSSVSLDGETDVNMMTVISDANKAMNDYKKVKEEILAQREKQLNLKNQYASEIKALYERYLKLKDKVYNS